MIAPQTFNNFPEFGTAAVKCRPDDTKYANGYIQGDLFPAEHVNWFFNGATVGVSALQLGMDSLEHEMQTLLSCAGKSTCATCCSQVYESISYLIQQSADTKAPKAHASSATTYGVGTADCYGHLKISDTYTSVLSACSGVAASQMAVACVYGVANGKPDLGNTAGCELGTASAGTATTAARADHVHPVPSCLHTTDRNPWYSPWYGFLRYEEASRKYLLDVSQTIDGTERYGVSVAYASTAGSASSATSACSANTANEIKDYCCGNNIIKISYFAPELTSANWIAAMKPGTSTELNFISPNSLSVKYATCASKDGSGFDFGTAARYNYGDFRPSIWLPSCVHTSSDTSDWYLYINYDSQKTKYVVDVSNQKTGGTRYGVFVDCACRAAQTAYSTQSCSVSFKLISNNSACPVYRSGETLVNNSGAPILYARNEIGCITWIAPPGTHSGELCNVDYYYIQGYLA